MQVLFGILSDRYGRKWPLVANLLLCSAVQLGTSFVQTFRQFLAVRTLFGIAMGGVWGLASSTALENLPVEARGLGSGVLQQGYAIGYLISAVLNLYIVPHTRHTWRTLFWTTSGISAFAATIRAFIPESEVFLRAKEQERALGGSTENKTKQFISQIRTMLKTHWRLCVYAILLMAGALVWAYVRGRGKD
jgi:SHS family lactate transporter-like MFS transporter